MESNTPLTTYSDALDATLVKRLLNPLVQPGLTDHALAKRILERSQRFSDRLPLSKLAEHRVQNGYGTGQIPIVYAQPLPPTTVSPSVVASSQLTPNASFTTVIQAKFIPSAAASPTISTNPIYLTSNTSNSTGHTTSTNPIQPASIETQNRSEPPIPPRAQEVIYPPAQGSPMTFVQEDSAPSNSPPSPGVTEIPVVVETKNIERSPEPLPPNDSRSRRRVIPPHQPAQRILEGEPLPSATLSPPIESLSPPLRNSNSVSSSNLVATTVVSQYPIVYVQFPAQSRITLGGMADAHELPPASRTVVHPRPPLSQGQSQQKAETAVGAIVTPLKRIEPPIPQERTLPPQVSTKMRVTAMQPINQSERAPFLFASPAFKQTISPRPGTEGMNFSNSFSESSAANVSITGMGRPIRTIGTSSDGSIPIGSTPTTNEAAAKPEQSPKVDIDAIANQVERKLMRRLVVERERRGQMTWKR